MRAFKRDLIGLVRVAFASEHSNTLMLNLHVLCIAIFYELCTIIMSNHVVYVSQIIYLHCTDVKE